MRVVLDTNILDRAARGSGPAAQILFEVASPDHVLVLSPFIVLELCRVLRYPRVRVMHGLGESEIDAFAQAIQSIGMMVVPVSPKHQVVTNDPDDDAILATAIEG